MHACVAPRREETGIYRGEAARLQKKRDWIDPWRWVSMAQRVGEQGSGQRTPALSGSLSSADTRMPIDGTGISPPFLVLCLCCKATNAIVDFTYLWSQG